ncbi:MAG: hypothetical protein ACREQT_11310 [Candidatus Binataceae bacterium]
MRGIAAILLTMFLIAAALPAFAQGAPPNPGAQEHWDQFLSRHPGLAEHPQWLRNPTYMHEHPNMAKWLQEHPRVAREARQQGMWEHDGTWHDSNWWHENNPNYASQYHPEWAENHPDWRGENDGDWDQNHKHWHARDWWVRHHRDEVEQRHPDWLAGSGHERDHHDSGNHQERDHHD